MIEGLDLTELRQFGEEANRLRFPSIADGGIVVSGRRAATPFFPGKEEDSHGRRTEAAQAGSAAWARERPPAKAAAASAPAYAVQRDPALKRLIYELADYGAEVTVVRRSARFVCLELPVGLFASLPFRAKLLIEVPTIPRSDLRAGLPGLGMVPDVRVWSRWSSNVPDFDGLISSHHGYPDSSMCVCMPHEWQLHRDPIIRYVDFSIEWIARALHERLLGVYPGLQHYGEKVRVERDRPDEFCGCGKALAYGACHRQSDFAMSWLERAQRHYSSQRAYRDELAAQGRAPGLPDHWA